MNGNGLRDYIAIGLLAIMIAMPTQVFAQDSAPAFRQEELDQLLAPIALYPDSLLAQILMASTYPLEVVLADRWIKANSDLQGDALNDALDLENWDPSVKALVPFPNILSMMSEELDWTQRLGEAFLVQEIAVMDTIQQLRERAYAAGTLNSNEQLLVSREDESIIIGSYNPQVVYVPVYDPWEVYGPWWWPHYPPYIVYRYPSNVVIAPGIIWYGAGFSVGVFWNHGWGYWDWGHRRCYVNVNRTVNINRTVIVNKREIGTTPWKHNRKHRRGVAYRVPATRAKFASANHRDLQYHRNDRDYTQSRPAGKRSDLSQPAQKLRTDKKIRRPTHKSRPDATVVKRPSLKPRPAPGISRPAEKRKSSKKITRSSPKVRFPSTVIERSTTKTRPKIEASRSSSKSKSSKKITRSSPNTKARSTAIVRSTPKVRAVPGVSRPASKPRPSKKIIRSSPKARPHAATIERPSSKTRQRADVARSVSKPKSRKEVTRSSPKTRSDYTDVERRWSKDRQARK